MFGDIMQKVYCFCFVFKLMESRGSKNYAELMNFIEQQFVELSAVIESSMKKYQGSFKIFYY